MPSNTQSRSRNRGQQIQELPKEHDKFPCSVAHSPPSILSLPISALEDQHVQSRIRVSPSPELSFSSLDFNDAAERFWSHNYTPANANVSHNLQALPSSLEPDEEEFAQVAWFLQRRDIEEHGPEQLPSVSAHGTQTVDLTLDIIYEAEETEESAARKDSEMATALFGQICITFSNEPEWYALDHLIGGY
jgi:hypothetical protein